MNDIDSMPPKCRDCPYWEMCEEPYIFPTQDEKGLLICALDDRVKDDDMVCKHWIQQD